MVRCDKDTDGGGWWTVIIFIFIYGFKKYV